MARLNKNGNLSGAIGNIIFVNNGDRSYAKAKGKDPKQTDNTKKSYTAFGMVSTVDKQFRAELMAKVNLVTSTKYAPSHRTQLRRTALQTDLAKNKIKLEYTDPQFLVGYNFNRDFNWDQCVRFFPEFHVNADGKVTIQIPALTWGKEIKAPAKATRAELTISIISTNLNAPIINVKNIATLTLHISTSEKTEMQSFEFKTAEETGWMLVTGSISFSSLLNNIKSEQKGASTYLWAKSII